MDGNGVAKAGGVLGVAIRRRQEQVSQTAFQHEGAVLY